MAEYGRLEYSLLSCYAHGCAVCPGIEEYIFAPLTLGLVMWLALANGMKLAGVLDVLACFCLLTVLLFVRKTGCCFKHDEDVG